MEGGSEPVSCSLCKIDHVKGRFYATQIVLQGMDRICSGNISVRSSVNGKDWMLELSFSSQVYDFSPEGIALRAHYALECVCE